MNRRSFLASLVAAALAPKRLIAKREPQQDAFEAVGTYQWTMATLDRRVPPGMIFGIDPSVMRKYEL